MLFFVWVLWTVRRNIAGVLFFITKLIVEGSKGLTFALTFYRRVIDKIMTSLTINDKEHLDRLINN